MVQRISRSYVDCEYDPKPITWLFRFQLKKWEDHFREYGRGITMFRTTAIINLVIEGIPDALRQELWMLLSGAIHEKETNPGLYEDLVEKVRQWTIISPEIPINVVTICMFSVCLQTYLYTWRNRKRFTSFTSRTSSIPTCWRYWGLTKSSTSLCT